MDGTLTLPGAIDFNAMYGRNNFDRNNGDILTQINRLSNDNDKKRAHDIIIEEEIKGIERMQIREHLSLLIESLNNNNINVAISTRNNEAALYKFLEVAQLKPDQFTHLLHRDSINIDGNITFDMKMFDQVLDYIKDKDFEESPSCRVYKQIILLELNREEKDYKKLLELKDKYEDNFSAVDILSRYD